MAMARTGLLFSVVLHCAGSLVMAQQHQLSINAELAENKYGVPSLIVPLPCQARIYSRGHSVNYICMRDGKIMCLPGWKNPSNYCRDPVCPELCTEDRGICKQPNECTCKNGYFGDLCQDVLAFPGCLHGKPDRPFTCVCDEGWEGIRCDRAICSEDCHPDNGYCVVPGTCMCNEDWEGENCLSCKKLPGCANGNCTLPMQCNCFEGWKGAHCDEPVCDSACRPPFGKCEEPGQCVCEMGYSGDNCNECQTYPGCKNGRCYELENGMFVPWSCKCDPDWMGMLCDQPRDPSNPFQASQPAGTMGLGGHHPHSNPTALAGSSNPSFPVIAPPYLMKQLTNIGRVDEWISSHGRSAAAAADQEVLPEPEPLIDLTQEILKGDLLAEKTVT